MLVNGKRTRIVGRVSMDMITVDISDMPEAEIGAPAAFDTLREEASDRAEDDRQSNLPERGRTGDAIHLWQPSRNASTVEDARG